MKNKTMKLKFKHQRFQADAAKAVCDVFAGQPYKTANYAIDPGAIEGQRKSTSA
jgi:type III restriction enzyme